MSSSQACIFRTSYGRMLSTVCLFVFVSSLCWNDTAWQDILFFAKYIRTVATDTPVHNQKSNNIKEHWFASSQIAYLPLAMEALSRKSGNEAEEKTCGLFSFLPNSLWRDLQQIISCLSLSRTEVNVLASFMCYMRPSHDDARCSKVTHSMGKLTLISARLNVTLEDSRSIYSLLKVAKKKTQYLLIKRLKMDFNTVKWHRNDNWIQPFFIFNTLSLNTIHKKWN